MSTSTTHELTNNIKKTINNTTITIICILIVLKNNSFAVTHSYSGRPFIVLKTKGVVINSDNWIDEKPIKNSTIVIFKNENVGAKYSLIKLKIIQTKKL